MTKYKPEGWYECPPGLHDALHCKQCGKWFTDYQSWHKHGRCVNK